jgi:hypothetical protein
MDKEEWTEMTTTAALLVTPVLRALLTWLLYHSMHRCSQPCLSTGRFYNFLSCFIVLSNFLLILSDMNIEFFFFNLYRIRLFETCPTKYHTLGFILCLNF